MVGFIQKGHAAGRRKVYTTQTDAHIVASVWGIDQTWTRRTGRHVCGERVDRSALGRRLDIAATERTLTGRVRLQRGDAATAIAWRLARERH